MDGIEQNTRSFLLLSLLCGVDRSSFPLRAMVAAETLMDTYDHVLSEAVLTCLVPLAEIVDVVCRRIFCIPY